MTENRRIFLNIVATYGRALFALACGLFSGRWLLMSLGEIDYGLFGVVGGLSGFIGFISGLIAAAVGRFYTFAIGQARITGREGLEECRKWFNTAVLLHTVIPVVLMICGYPIGEYAIRNGWIFIPPDRMNACLWVFRFSCLSCFLGLVTVPFNAMYGAKQYIAELTVYSFVTTTLNVCFLYYMVTHPGDWLARYALWGTLLSIAPNLIIAVRAYQLFPECRFRRAYLWDWGRVKALFSYAGAQFFGCFSAMLRQQGIAILVNRYFRATRNADISVANTVAGHCFTLAGCMTGAFAPALTTARGAEDWSRMHGLAFRTCKIGVLLVFLFALPMMLEVDLVMKLWLKDPPHYAAMLCLFFLVGTIIERSAWGHSLALNANGKIWGYQLAVGIVNFAIFPITWILLAFTHNIATIGVTFVLVMIGNALVLVIFARKLVAMGIRRWVFTVVLPICLLASVCLVIGALPRFLLTPSFWRLCITTATIEIVLLPTAWFLVLAKDERVYIREKLSKLIDKFRK